MNLLTRGRRPETRLRRLVGPVGAAVIALAAVPAAASATAGVMLDNGLVQLGVHAEGHLNVPSSIPSSGTGTTSLGLRYKPTNADATAPGCLCEGWGAADAKTGTTGYANEDDGGPQNIELVSFESTGSTAKSVVTIGGRLQVTHDYHPSRLSPNLYEVIVGIKNISSAPIDARYRRVMDWDVEPTAFNEYVTMETGSASGFPGSTALLYNDNNGFATANPLVQDLSSGLSRTGDFTDNGPSDQGARFDFGFNSVAAGTEVRFRTFYGAAQDEATAVGALATVGAEVYSLGEPSTPTGRDRGEPNTFVFGFAGVGGEPAVTDDKTIPKGAFGRWPKAAGPGKIYFNYGGEHRYLGNLSKAAENWTGAGSSLAIEQWPGVPFPNHISVFDVDSGRDAYGWAVARGCEPSPTGGRCVFNRNSLFMNKRLTDSTPDFFRTLIATHEMGHSLGMCHQSGGECGVTLSASTRSIMHAGGIITTKTTYNTPQPHDIELLKELYP